MKTEEIFPGAFHPSGPGHRKGSPLDTGQNTVSSIDSQPPKIEAAVANAGESVFPKDGLKIGSLDTQEKDLRDVLSCVEYYVKAIKEIKKISETMERFELDREENFRKNFAAERSDYDEEGAKEYLRRLDERRSFLIAEVQKVRDLFGCEDGFKEALQILKKIKDTESCLPKAKDNIEEYDNLVVERQRLVDDLRDLLEIYGGFSQSDLPIVADIFSKIKLLKTESGNKIDKERLKKLLLLLSNIKESLKNMAIYERAIIELERRRDNTNKKKFEEARAGLVEKIQKLLEEAQKI